jgi:heptosyltransferase III
LSRTLLIRPGGIGDSILCFPAMEHVRSVYTEVWISGPVVPLVTFADCVEAISTTGLDRLGIPGLSADARLVARLQSFDRIVSWYGTNRPEFREAVAGLPFEFHAALPDGQVHAVDFFAQQVGLVSGCVPCIPVPRREPRGFVAVHPFSGGAKKNWPLAWFDRVASETGLAVEWCATAEQRPLLGQRGPVHCFDSLMDLAQWVAGARCYYGNDSGITHLAAAVGTPVVAVFGGASDPAVWAPRGEHVTLLDG